MKKKRRLIAGIMAAALICQSVFTQGLGGIGAGLIEVQAAATNVALNKDVEASSVEMAGCEGSKAVDGTKGANSRWSSQAMLPLQGKTEETPQTPQWVIIDLEAQETEVENIKVFFHAKVWSTKYQIQTCDTKTGEWETVYDLPARPSADTTNPTDEIGANQLTTTTLKRFVRFYFEKLNINAGWNCVSVSEIEIMGTQSGTIETAQGVLDRITSLPVAAGDTELQIPQTSQNYEVAVYGSEVDKVIGDDGRIAPLRIRDRSMNIILQAVNKADPADTAKKNITVTVPNNISAYPQLFPTVANPNEEPEVLPTIQEWYGYEGNFTLSETTEIVYNDAANVDLAGVAKEMQEDLQEICGFAPAIKAGTSSDSDDIYLESQVTDTYGTGEEGYLLVNGDDGIQIYSSTRQGALYGTVTVEQILYQDAEHKTVPKGVIRDYPLYAVRGMMMDVARIPTRLQMIRDYTKLYKWFKLNEMHLHLNDGQWSNPAYSPNYSDWAEVEGSHRLYSDTFPGLATQKSKFLMPTDNPGRYDYYYSTHTGVDGELYYTKEEFVDLQHLANHKGVSVMAELDTPSHSNAYARYVYENQEEVIQSLVERGYLSREDYLNADGSIKDGASFYIQNPSDFELLSIDLESSNAEEAQNAANARIFMTALYDEYLNEENPIFLNHVVGAGVDEYWLKGTQRIKEAFRKYMNFMKELIVDQYGKEVRMWGSLKQFPGATEVSKDIVIEVWNSTYEENPLERIAEGYQVINIPQPFLYTTPGRYHKDMINEEYIYENWDPTMFTTTIKADKGEPLLKGAKAALWGDENREGITEADLHERYSRLAAMVSEKNWGGTKEDDTFLEYEQTFDRVRNVPGTQIANQIESKTNIVVDYDFANVSEDQTVVYDQSGNGYHGTINGGQIEEIDGKSWLKFDGNTTVNTPLTSLGYPYTMSFDVYLDGTETNDKEASLFSGYDGRLQVAGLSGNMSLNRSHYTQSFGYQVPTGEKHRISIVGTYQVTKLYVDGEFKKILYAAASDTDNGGNIGAATWTDADNNFRTTFVFPLNVIGKNFSGYLGNITAYNKALSVEEFAVEGLATEVDVARNRHAYTDLTNSTFWTDNMRLYPAWKATDGDGHITGVTGVSTSNESRWNSSNSDKDFLMVDLGQSRKISKVVIDWEANRYGASYNIQVSQDGKNWTTVKTITNNTQALTTDTFAETEARYVKMQGVQRKSGSNEYCIYEIKVYGSVNKTALDTISQETAVLLQENGIAQGSNTVGASLLDAYVNAKAVVKDVMAGQEEVAAALSALNAENARWSTTLTQLSQTLLQAEAIFPDQSQYEAASWGNFIQAYEEVKNASADSSVEELNQLITALDTAQQTLVRLPDPDEPGPVDPTPDEPGPVDPTPDEPGPVDPDPDEPGPVDPDPDEPGPVDPTPDEPGPVDPTPDEPGPVDPTPDEPGPVDPTPDEPGPVDPTPVVPGPGPVVPTPTPVVPDPEVPDEPDQPDVQPIVLGAPKVKAVTSQEKRVKITWKKIASADSYQVYRKIGTKVTVIGQPTTANKAYDLEPVANKTMTYYVIALAGSKEGYSNSREGKSKSIILPANSSKFTAEQLKGKVAVSLKWTKVKKATSYIIYRKTGKGAWKKLVTLPKKSIAYTDEKVNGGKTYTYKIVTVANKKYSPGKQADGAVSVKA